MARGTDSISARIAIVGTGYVADLYMPSLATFPGLKVTGAWDIDAGRLAAFTQHWGVRAATSFDDLLSEGAPTIILNLTDPTAHAAINRAAIEAGRHVWCEKPLALTTGDALALRDLAIGRGVHLASAPCSVLGRAAQSAWKALRENRIGKPRLVYAELDDDFIPAAPYHDWHSASGTPCPAQGEFRIGCTLEHAGYYLSWLMAMFGPVDRIVSGSARLLDDAQTGAGHSTPDYASASLFFVGGTVARLTCSIVARHDHRLRIFGDDGIVEIDEAWANAAPVRIRKRFTLRRRLINSPFAARAQAHATPHPLVGRKGAASMNFALGVAEMAQAIAANRAPRLAGDFALHLTEVSIAMQAGGEHRIASRFDAMAPMDWA